MLFISLAMEVPVGEQIRQVGFGSETALRATARKETDSKSATPIMMNRYGLIRDALKRVVVLAPAVTRARYRIMYPKSRMVGSSQNSKYFEKYPNDTSDTNIKAIIEAKNI